MHCDLKRYTTNDEMRYSSFIAYNSFEIFRERRCKNENVTGKFIYNRITTRKREGVLRKVSAST